MIAANARTASTPPSGEAAATRLTYDAEASALIWGYCAPGDYNQDGEVGIGDLTPLGLHFGETSPDGAGQPFPWDSVGAVVDGDGNGTIGISDVTPIGQSFGRHVQGYHVYRSFDSADYPQTPTAANGPGALGLGTVPLAQATGAAAAGRKQFSLAIADPQPGAYYWARPYDSAEDGTPSNLAAGAGANLPPIAALAADPPAGPVPLTVHFSAQASYDSDGSLVKYEWDFDGPLNGEQWEDTGATPSAEHTYDKSGVYFPTLRVTDDRGLADTDFAQVSVKSPPVARLDFTGVTDIYKHLLWDASGGTDMDGEVVQYEWDFDGDGVYEFDASAGGAAAAQQALQDFYYYESGAYTVGVRVTDDDGLTATASKSVTLVVAMTWHSVVSDEMLDMPAGKPYGPADGMIDPCTLVDVGGHPAIFYQKLRSNNPNNWPIYDLCYVKALDPHGDTWGNPIPIAEMNQGLGYPSFFGAATDIPGRPAAAYTFSTDDEFGQFVKHSLYYVCANDPLGADWASAREISVSSNHEEYLAPGTFQQLGDRLAITGVQLIYGSPFDLIISNDLAGASWNEPTRTSLSLAPDTTSTSVVDGFLAIVRNSNAQDLVFQRAKNLTGSSWTDPVFVDQLEKVSRRAVLLITGGYPAAVYYDDNLAALKFRKALDVYGSNWGSESVITTKANSDHISSVIDGRPAVLYTERLTGHVKFISAIDASGTLWTFPVQISPDDSVHISNSYSSYSLPAPTFTSIAALPGLAHIVSFDDGAGNLSHRLEYIGYN